LANESGNKPGNGRKKTECVTNGDKTVEINQKRQEIYLMPSEFISAVEEINRAGGGKKLNASQMAIIVRK
jgi:hypothetical protein